MSKVANVVGRLKVTKKTFVGFDHQGIPFQCLHKLNLTSCVMRNDENEEFPLPWFHENTTKMDLSMKINIQHLFKVVLKRQHLKNTRKLIKKMFFGTVHTSKTRFKLGFKYEI